MAVRIDDTEDPVIAKKYQSVICNFNNVELQQIMTEATRPQSATIFIFGRVGSGKSSLASCIVGQDTDAFKIKSGLKPDETGIDKVSIQVGQVTLNVVDTHGMMDPSEGSHNEDTIELMSSITRNEMKGMLIVCIEMHERIDESTLEALAKLHKRFKDQCIWQYVVFALTKADRYDEHEWLEAKKFGKSKKAFLREKFAEALENCKTSLKGYFTNNATIKVKQSCRIGMSAEEFDKIPIIPTSKLKMHTLDRMKQVGCQYWFDVLLIKCCQRIQGCGLIRIHEERLSKLPSEVVRQEIGDKAFEMLQKTKSNSEFILGIIQYYIWYKHMYHKETATLPRFEYSNGQH